MDLRALAAYAYHNCELQRSVDLIREQSPDEALAEIHVKALSELDQKDASLKWATTYAHAFPRSGALRYLVGMSAYLAGRPVSAVAAAFAEAAALDYGGGAMGMAFIAFVDRRFTEAADLLGDARGLTNEMDHVRRLMLFQVHATADRLDLAEGELRQADRLLQASPSLLRHLWGQLCWVRFLRAKGAFEGGRAILERVIAQVSPETTPRLYRNAVEAMKMIEIRSDDPNIILPPKPLAVVSAPSPISRRPMLRSLYSFLAGVGPTGASKEAIAQSVWEENYNPIIHDDRIYKAIGRLRKLLGDNQDDPKLLIQMGRHYVLTASAVPRPDGASS